MSTDLHDAQLLAIGKQCSHSSCLLVDFLPFKCQHCEESFCQEHFMVSAHRCPMYDETKYNRVAPDCPFCHTPVAFAPGQDPNIKMELHFTTKCSVLTGKSGRSSSTPVCAKTNCKKVLFSPIRCDKCKYQFCPSHRFPSDHNCSAPQTAIPARPAAKSNLLDKFDAKKLSKATDAGAAALGAIKKSISSGPTSASASTVSASASSSTKPSPAKSGNSTPNLFSKTDRRARAERDSRIKAMQARARKGLLSEEEKAILAAEEQEAKGDCVVM
ncbi:hypothetical protein BDN72DRAFT_778250 [Pluteus cervinus]|uniref:Uncharacterized protein n=1 Tax=Pluteus cervinus TaxID=181527 RepID=A0ACD3A681_9AGAR|nr:hypothetical protein BDN72DRAFT_778250 [Pluteus cervinus]